MRGQSLSEPFGLPQPIGRAVTRANDADAQGVRRVQPAVLLAGLNPVSTDAVAAAVMGYDPRAARGTAPFQTCENTLLLAERHGVGSANLRGIDVRGVPIAGAMFRYGV